VSTVLLTSFCLALIVLQFALPRRLAFLPLLIAVCHVPIVTVFGDFSTHRLVVLAGLTRAALSGGLQWSPRNPLDMLFLIWSGFALLSTVGHETIEEFNPLVFRAGLVLNVFGTYLYGKAFLRRPETVVLLAKCLVLVLLPLGGLMALEQRSGLNPYKILGARREEAAVREDRVRAQGPFRHPILAGTAGGSSLALVCILMRRRTRLWAAAGIGSCFLISVASASSGPILAFMTGAGAVYLWRWRDKLRYIQIGTAAVLVTLHLVMKVPIWYLMARIDLAGGSTGWHRAKLIDSAIAHLNEWWLFGTDYTRHWMPSGVSWSRDHADITNYYLHLGVIGGLPLMLALVAILVMAFRLLGRRMQQMRAAGDPHEFILWCTGAALLSHSISFFSISYFDQMYALFYLTVAAVPALSRSRVRVVADKPAQPTPVDQNSSAQPGFA
jgi:hypothetical protein